MNKTTATERQIAFCVPVMNRLGDLQHTLVQNVSVVQAFANEVQLIVGCFDETDECEQWVLDHFPRALESGLLRFERFPPLPYWHFSWAKNAFGEVVDAHYYSSLDGDNLLSADEIAKTLALVRDPTRKVLVHHFSGNWGDGTHGRITLPASVYREHPYVEELMPRQFDETGVILRVLAQHSDVVYVSRLGVDIFQQSAWCREFIELNGIQVNHETADLGATENPANPRGDQYVRRSPKLFHFQQLNAAYTGWRFSLTEDSRNFFLSRLGSAQRAYARLPECYDDLQALFTRVNQAALETSEAITLYTVNRNNFAFLRPWLRHYRDLGVERFIVVDDGSQEPLENWMAGDDVFIVRPRFGAFRTSKVFWLRVLMGTFQTPGSWVLTADVDEFLDVAAIEQKETASPLAGLIRTARDSGWRHFPALLLDMMPDPQVVSVDSDNFLDTMTWHYDRPVSHELGYQHRRPVQWAFGNQWPIALSVDIRYRLYGTLDCLRKIPLFRFDRAIDLNQGFHSLLHEGVSWTLDELLPASRGLLPLRHYKLAKVFWEHKETHGPFERAEQYFGRTQANLRRIAASDADYIRRCWQATPFKRRYEGPTKFAYYRKAQAARAAQL